MRVQSGFITCFGPVQPRDRPDWLTGPLCTDPSLEDSGVAVTRVERRAQESGGGRYVRVICASGCADHRQKKVPPRLEIGDRTSRVGRSKRASQELRDEIDF